ncbi:MAG: 30S ribosomal protein S17 [Candidatus Buchananbacteria bacterium]|jgi:small subunit ribosomal protein S17
MEKKFRKFKGTVVSDKMDKTIVVKVESFKTHPKLKKRYRVDKKYKVHDEKGQYKIDDVVDFVECRPLSKDKKWRVIY